MEIRLVAEPTLLTEPAPVRLQEMGAEPIRSTEAVENNCRLMMRRQTYTSRRYHSSSDTQTDNFRLMELMK